MKDADVFLGCSAPGVVTQDMVKSMGSQPIILALANPEPEIRPELAKEVRPDCIIATGRSDYPNQVNNVLCFPVHLPRRARLRRQQDHRGNEAGLRARDRRPDQGRHQRGSGHRLRRPGTVLRPRLHHSQALRFAPDPAHRAGRGQGGAGLGRGRAADRGPGSLPPAPDALRLPDRHVHAAGVQRRQARQGQARGLRRGRGRPRAARRPAGGRRRPGTPDPDRPSGRDRGAHQEGRPAHRRWARTSRCVDPENDPRFRTVLGGLPQADGPARHHARGLQGDGAALQHHHRRADGAPGRRRRHAVRPGRALRQPPEDPATSVLGLQRGAPGLRHAQRADAREAHAVHRRHQRARRPERRDAGRTSP